jgi:sugar-specific transcriptional regulator TrmB
MASTNDDFDWVSAQAACSTAEMFQRLLDGARKDVERRINAAPDRDDQWDFEVHSDNEDHFEVARKTNSSKSGAFVTFERVGPRINISGDGVDVELFAVVGINHAGDCRYYVGEVEYMGWEIRKMALDVLFFEQQED